tara:strand:+ start:387 stop:608 length:222 start_codon:yes stop_codon:yes gene_type:complete
MQTDHFELALAVLTHAAVAAFSYFFFSQFIAACDPKEGKLSDWVFALLGAAFTVLGLAAFWLMLSSYLSFVAA